MKRLLATVTMALLASVALATVASGAPGSGGGNHDSASGSVTEFDVKQTFSARSSSIGTNAQGSWRATVTSSDPNTTFTGDIRCLRVATVSGVGAVFEARGVIVNIHNNPGATVQGFVLQGSDSGKFSHEPDTFVGFPTDEPQLEGSCLAPTPAIPVQDGEIIVKDAF